MSDAAQTSARPESRTVARRLLAVVLIALALTGCAGVPRTVQPGQTLADALSTMGAPTGRHALADGAQRLEYATGPMGLHTWMVDLDAQGRVMTVAQVLSPPFFAQVQPGMARDDLLRLLGRPGERRAERGGGELWSWRFEGPFCLRLQVSLSARGQVREGAVQSPDPLCTPEQ